MIKSTYLRATYSMYLSHTSTLYVCDKQSTRNCSTGSESLVFTSLRVFCAVILPVIMSPPLSLSLCFWRFVMIRCCCQRGHEDLCFIRWEEKKDTWDDCCYFYYRRFIWRRHDTPVGVTWWPGLIGADWTDSVVNVEEQTCKQNTLFPQQAHNVADW